MFPQRLKDLRAAHHLTQSELGDKIHVSSKTVGAWERGTRQPTIEAIGSLSELFDVTTDYLIGKTTDPNKSVPKHINVDDIVNNAAPLTSRHHALSEEDQKAIRAMLTTYLNSAEGQDRLRKYGGYGDDGKKIEKRSD